MILSPCRRPAVTAGLAPTTRSTTGWAVLTPMPVSAIDRKTKPSAMFIAGPLLMMITRCHQGRW